MADDDLNDLNGRSIMILFGDFPIVDVNDDHQNTMVKAMVEGIASVLCVDALEGLSCRGIYRRRPDLQVAKWGWKRETEKREME